MMMMIHFPSRAPRLLCFAGIACLLSEIRLRLERLKIYNTLLDNSSSLLLACQSRFMLNAKTLHDTLFIARHHHQPLLDRQFISNQMRETRQLS